MDELEAPLWQRDMDSDFLAFDRRQAAPSPAPAPSSSTATNTNIDKSSTNKAGMANNKGAIVASGSNIKKEETCKIMVEGRDLHHLLEPRASRGHAAPKSTTRRAGGGGGGKKAARGAPAQSKQAKAAAMQQKFKTAHWVEAKTTTDKQGEIFYKAKCYCQCKRDDIWGGEEVMMMQRGIEIAGPDATHMIARLEPTCSIVGDGVSNTKRWLGNCKRSTLGDYPVTSLLQRAEV